MSQPAFEFDDIVPDDTVDPTFSVGELADAINEELRRGFRGGVWVRGEISGLSNRGPHTYFSLIEETDRGSAVLNVQLFAPTIAKIAPMLRTHRLQLRNGMKVRIHGQLDFWAQGGRLGLKMSSLDPAFTLGEISQSRDEVLRRLIASGLTEANKRRPMSAVPLRVGVVASVDSAGFADFHSELERSSLGFELTVTDTRVQGDGAELMVSGAIGTLARGARKGVLDVIVVIRGGGAKNELALFDSERIAHSIAMVQVPVFTGIGHEIDRTIADEVAHTSLKTPTACAGALVERVEAYVSDTEAAFEAIVRASLAHTDRSEHRLRDVARQIAARTTDAVGRADERLARRTRALVDSAPQALAAATGRVDVAAGRLVERSGLVTERAGHRLELLDARIRSVDPAVQLARGWSITRNSSGAVVRSAADLSPGDLVSTHLLDGHLTSTVEAIDLLGPADPPPQAHAAESDDSDD